MKINEKFLSWAYIIITLLLAVGGIYMVFSTSVITRSSTDISTVKLLRQMKLGFGPGIIIMLTLGFFKVEMWRKLLKKINPVLLLTTMFLLIAVLIIGVDIKGAKRWIDLGIRFQPSDLARLTLIIFTAFFIDKNKKALIYEPKIVILPLTILSFISFLIFLEPDMSSSVLILLIPVILLYIAVGAIPKKVYLIGAAVCGIGLVGMVFTQQYRLERIKEFYTNADDIRGKNMQSGRAKMALANGGFSGTGLGTSHEKTILPESHNDFLFAIIGEELGFLGTSFIVLLYFGIFILGVVSFFFISDTFGKYLVLGLSTNIAMYALLHIYVNVSIIPTTGVALPFMSYGSTSLILNFTAIGLIVNTISNNNIFIRKEVFANG